MNGLVKTLVAIAVLAVLVREGLPWLQRELGSSPIATLAPGRIPEPAATCLRRVGTVRGELEATRGFLSSQRERRSSYESALGSAREACSCRTAGCRQANDALDAIDAFAGSGPAGDPAAGLARIDELIDQARRAARQGG